MARRVIPRDAEINTMEKTIEHSCMNLLALQQPLARDLRVITATLKILTLSLIHIYTIQDGCNVSDELLTIM